MTQPIGQWFAQRDNNFDLLRLAGAVTVLFSHAYVLTGQAASEPIGRVLGGAADGGRLAVGMFFVVSGFLVARSVQTHRAGDYLLARLLRIWPGLATVVVTQTLLIGLVCTSLSAWAYLTEPATWIALARGLAFNPRLGLPGVFADNPVPAAINGSLWTLRIEALCYLLLLGAAWLGLLRGGAVLLLAAGGVALAGATQIATPGALPPVLTDPRVISILGCGAQFLAGSALWVHRDAVPRSALLAGAGLLALLLLAHTSLAPFAFHLVFPYLVICLGLGPGLFSAALRRLGDISYGTYLYAFPVQQAIVAWLGPGIGPLGLVAMSLGPVLMLAVLSSRLIERPALRLKRRLAGGRETSAAALAQPSRQAG